VPKERVEDRMAEGYGGNSNRVCRVNMNDDAVHCAFTSVKTPPRTCSTLTPNVVGGHHGEQALFVK
jgi:hypothetical protein